MKKSIINLVIVGALLFLASSIYTSCKKDECKDVVCQNGGTCDAGTCQCTTGYEGTNCGTLTKTKFLKTAANVTEVCGTTTSTPYTTDIVSGSAVNEIKIKNLGNYNCTTGDYYVVATVNGTSLTISTQTVCATVFSGSGTYSSTNSKITITYTASYNPGSGTVTDNCTATID